MFYKITKQLQNPNPVIPCLFIFFFFFFFPQKFIPKKQPIKNPPKPIAPATVCQCKGEIGDDEDASPALSLTYPKGIPSAAKNGTSNLSLSKAATASKADFNVALLFAEFSKNKKLLVRSSTIS